jgi:hypothetical protein
LALKSFAVFKRTKRFSYLFAIPSGRSLRPLLNLFLGPCQTWSLLHEFFQHFKEIQNIVLFVIGIDGNQAHKGIVPKRAKSHHGNLIFIQRSAQRCRIYIAVIEADGDGIIKTV